MKTIGALFFCLIPLTAQAGDDCRVTVFPQRYEVSCSGQPTTQQQVTQGQEQVIGEAQPQMPASSHHRRPNPADLESARAERARLITQDQQN